MRIPTLTPLNWVPVTILASMRYMEIPTLFKIFENNTILPLIIELEGRKSPAMNQAWSWITVHIQRNYTGNTVSTNLLPLIELNIKRAMNFLILIRDSIQSQRFLKLGLSLRFKFMNSWSKKKRKFRIQMPIQTKILMKKLKKLKKWRSLRIKITHFGLLRFL